MTIPRTAPAARRTPPFEEQKLRAKVQRVLARLSPGKGWNERRRDQRYAFPFLIELAPVAGESDGVPDEPLVVVAKDLSERGLGFYHQRPLPNRLAIVSLEDADGETVSLLVELPWCRFIRPGWYESGGRFLRIVEP